MDSITYYTNADCFPGNSPVNYADATINQCYSTHSALSVHFVVNDCPGVWHIATYSDSACQNGEVLDLTSDQDCFASHNGTITAVRFACGPVGQQPSATSSASISPSSVTLAVAATSAPIAPASSPTTATSSPASVITSPVNAISSPATSPTPISAGAIAGIVIGAVVAIGIIAGLFTIICLRERRRRHHDRPLHVSPVNPRPNLNPLAQTLAAPPPMEQYTHPAPMPSASSTTPLTQANIAAISPRSEVSPNDSVSQYNVPGPIHSHGSPAAYYAGAGSNTASHDQSSVSPLLSHNYPTGVAAFPHQNSPSVMTPGSAFGSMPPVHAPSVASNRPLR